MVGLCALVWFVGVYAQEVWSVIENNGDRGKNENEKQKIVSDNDREDTLYSWSSPNALTRSTLLDRQERLQYKCDQISRGESPDNPEAFHNLLVDDEHKLLYCYVPKVNKYVLP